jgi:hypothetical protein
MLGEVQKETSPLGTNLKNTMSIFYLTYTSLTPMCNQYGGIRLFKFLPAVISSTLIHEALAPEASEDSAPHGGPSSGTYCEVLTLLLCVQSAWARRGTNAKSR